MRPFAFCLLIGKFKEKAECLSNVAKRTAEGKTQDKHEGNVQRMQCVLFTVSIYFFIYCVKVPINKMDYYY